MSSRDCIHLRLIVEFIVGVYYPMWFRAKVQHNWLDSPPHVLRQLQLTLLQRTEAGV